MTYNNSKKEYNLKYAKERLKRIPLDVQKEKYTEIQAMAQATGQSVNGYIKRAIDETMERDKALLNNESGDTGTLKTEPTKHGIIQNDTSVKAVVMNDTKQEESPNKQYKQLTDSELAQIDLPRLLKDVLYQCELGEEYGIEVLEQLIIQARKKQ